MNCSWDELVGLAGWEFARPAAAKTLTFIYAAKVSLFVEESCASVNPNLPFADLERTLTKKPDWLSSRKEWLKTEWPQRPTTTTDHLQLFGLTAAKALLAVGSTIPGGTADELARAIESMFSNLMAEGRGDGSVYEAWNATVVTDTDGEMNWGYGGPLARIGKALPISDTNIGGRNAFEPFLQNQMRLAIQQRIETIASRTV